MSDPKKNAQLIFYVELVNAANPNNFISNPTLATGDVKIEKDGGAIANLATLPVVSPASSTSVKVTVSAAEMNADNIVIKFVDAAGGEWLPLSAYIRTATDTIEDVAATIGTAGAGLTDLGGMSTAMKAEVNAEADTALTDYDVPTNAEMIARTLLAADYFDPATDAVANVTLVDTTTTNTDMRGTDGANTTAPDNSGIASNGAAIAALNNLSSADVTAAVPSTAQIEAALINEGDGQQLIDAIVTLINTNLDLPALELAAIASQVRVELATELARIDVAVSTRTDSAAVAAELATYDAPTKAEMDSAFTQIKGATWSSVTDTLEAIRDRGDAAWGTATGFNTVVPDNAGIASNGSAIAGLNDISTTDLATSLSDINLDHLLKVSSVSADISNNSVIAKLVSKNSPALWGDYTPATDSLQANREAIDGLNNISTADINSQMLDVLNVDAFGEPSGVPAASATLQDKISFIYMALRNKLTVSTTDKTFYDDSGVSQWKKAVSDDGLVYTEDEGTLP